MARFMIRSQQKKPRETKLIQRGMLHSIAGEVNNITRVRTFVNQRKRLIESTYFDKLYLRWYRSILLFDEPVSLPNVGPTQTANMFHSLNNSQRYMRPTNIPRTEFLTSPVKHRPRQLGANDLYLTGGTFFRAG